jgi:hypothetical protein
VGRARLWLGSAAVAALLTLPLLLIAGPAVAAMPQSSCPGGMDCARTRVECPMATPARSDCQSGYQVDAD